MLKQGHLQQDIQDLVQVAQAVLISFYLVLFCGLMYSVLLKHRMSLSCIAAFHAVALHHLEFLKAVSFLCCSPLVSGLWNS